MHEFVDVSAAKHAPTLSRVKTKRNADFSASAYDALLGSSAVVQSLPDAASFVGLIKILAFAQHENI